MVESAQTVRGAVAVAAAGAGVPDPRVLDPAKAGRRRWVGRQVRPEEWLLPVTAEVRSELLGLVRQLREAPLPLLLRRPDQFRLAACRELLAEVRRRLTGGLGLAVLHRLPMDECSVEEAVTVHWVLGQLLAPPAATKWDGTILYDVTDTGRRFGRGVRGSATSAELSFHTDNAFGLALPDYVGLLCVHPAADGGVTRFCSLYEVHERMRARHPWLLRRLYQPVYLDRQGEHAPGAPELLWAPVFRSTGDRLVARLVPDLVRSGYEIAGEPMDEPLAEALDRLLGILAEGDLWVEFALRSGELQYANNLECAHYRSAFVDDRGGGPRRHLVRLWLRESGGPAYDG